LRLPILIYLAYVFIGHLSSFNFKSILYPLTVGMYELGYFTFSWMGEFIGVLGAVVFQLGTPIVAIFTCYFLGDFFALFFSFGWLSTSLFLIARYVTDAYAAGLPLIGPFSERNIVRDWNYFLIQAGLLPHARFIAVISKIMACAAMLICLIGGAWFLRQAKKNSLKAEG